MFNPCEGCHHRWRNQYTDCSVNCLVYKYHLQDEEKQNTNATIAIISFAALVLMVGAVIGMNGLARFDAMPAQWWEPPAMVAVLVACIVVWKWGQRK